MIDKLAEMHIFMCQLQRKWLGESLTQQNMEYVSLKTHWMTFQNLL